MLKNPDFLVIPHVIVADKRLRPTDRLIYGAVYWLERLRDGKCTASNKTIGGICLVGERAVGAGLERLEKTGYVQRVMKGPERVEIRTRVFFGLEYEGSVKGVEQMKEGGSTNVRVGGSTNVGQNNNPLIRKEKETATASVAVASKEKMQDGDPMTQADFIAWCKGPKAAKHIQIIAEWAEAEGPKYTTVGQWRAFIKRNLRVARRLTPFSLEQIEAAYAKMAKDIKSAKNPQGFITKYTLETLEKYL